MALKVALIGIACSVIARLLAEELKAWAPSLAKGIVRLAGICLPKLYQERFLEEWQSHIDEIPGAISKVLAAMGLVLAANRMNMHFRSHEKRATKSEMDEQRPLFYEAVKLIKLWRSLQEQPAAPSPFISGSFQLSTKINEGKVDVDRLDFKKRDR